MKIRAVKLVFGDGLTLIGIVPAEISDAELAARPQNEPVEVLFSDAIDVRAKVSVLVALQRLAAAIHGRVFH